MDVFILKVIEIAMSMLCIVLLLRAIAGAASIILILRLYPPRDQSEVDGYKKDFCRITALYIGAAAICYLIACLF